MCECCKDVIEPSLKLKRIVRLIKLIILLYILIMIFDASFAHIGYSFYLFFQMIMIMLGTGTKHFGYILMSLVYTMFILFLLLSSFYSWVQQYNIIYNNKLGFCFFAFLFSVEIFSIFVLFQFYKQAKHEFRIQYGFFAGDDQGEDNGDEQLIPLQAL